MAHEKMTGIPEYESKAFAVSEVPEEGYMEVPDDRGVDGLQFRKTGLFRTGNNTRPRDHVGFYDRKKVVS